MAPDRVYPDGEAPLATAAAPLPPPGEYYSNVKDQQSPTRGAYYNVTDQQNPPRGAYYNMKDQQIPPPAIYQESPRRRRSPCCCCLIWLCAIHVILLFLIGLAVLIFWLVVMPKAPQFDVKTVQISGLSLTGSSSSNTTINYEMMARNPNKKMSFYYSDINVKVEENGATIGEEIVPDFSQGHKNTTDIKGEIDNVAITSSTLNSISQNLSNVPLYAQVDLKVKVKVGSLKSGNFKVKVKCNVNVDLTVTTGTQLKSSKCKVDW